MALGDVAAALPWPVFACGRDKKPVVATGFKAATSDRAHVIAMFERPGAELIGVPTGKASGLIVIDIDIRADRTGMDWLNLNADALPETRTHKTRSGGLHLLFQCPSGVEIRNSAGKVAPGIDVRGEGGYIIAPPSPGYSVVDHTEPAEMPLWLIKACMPPERTERAPAAPRAARPDGGSKYGLAALANECTAIRSAPFGQQEITLNAAGLKIGALIGGGEIEEGIGIADLISAGRDMGSESGREPWQDDEVVAKVRRAVQVGMGTPRAAPPPKQHDIEEEPPSMLNDSGYWSSVQQDHNVAQEAAALPEGTNAIWQRSDAWDEADIPRRPWVAKGYLMAGSVAIAAGSGSAGKSSLGVGWGISLVLSLTWSRFKPAHPCIVSLYNVEDDDDEQRRRISATLRQFKKTPADLKGRLHRLGPTNVGTLIERDPATNRLRLTEAWDELIAHLEEVRPHVLILDPMVELHNADENDNTALRGVMATLRAMAVRFGMAVMVIHHARKGSAGAAGDPDMIRGAGAIVGAARVALTVSTMTEEEAEGMNIPKHLRHDYFRVDGAKQNYARVEQAEWFKREVYQLANGEEVAAAEPWKAPNVFVDTSSADINALLDRVGDGPEQGVLYAATKRGNGSRRWVGFLVMETFGMSEGQAKQMVETWLRNGLLVEVDFVNPHRREKATGVRVNDSKRPS